MKRFLPTKRSKKGREFDHLVGALDPAATVPGRSIVVGFSAKCDESALVADLQKVRTMNTGKSGDSMIAKTLLLGIGGLLVLGACSAEVVPEEAESMPQADESEEALAPALVGVAACLADPPCALVVAAAIGYAVKSVADISGEAIGAAQRAAARYQEQNGCSRSESYTPQRTDRASGCFDKKGVMQCYSARHAPCLGVHSHGVLSYNEVRGGRCVRITKPKAIRCEGGFVASGSCAGATTLCGVGGPAASGVYVQ